MNVRLPILACGVLGLGLLLGSSGCSSSTASGGGGSGSGGGATGGGGSGDCGGQACGANEACASCTSDDADVGEVLYCEDNAPTPGAGEFVCYNILCQIATQYCVMEEDELCAGAVTPLCKPLPDTCAAGASCDCVLQSDPALTSCDFGADATCKGSAMEGITVDTPCP